MAAERPSITPDIDTVRARLGNLLQTLEAADAMPLTEKQLRFWTTVVPQMSNWLPTEERLTVCAAFNDQIERLGRKAA